MHEWPLICILFCCVINKAHQTTLPEREATVLVVVLLFVLPEGKNALLGWLDVG